MKSRDTLIRLKKFQVDEKRRKVLQIETMIAEFDRMGSDLEREIVTEQQRAGINDPTTTVFGSGDRPAGYPIAARSEASPVSDRRFVERAFRASRGPDHAGRVERKSRPD